MAMNPRITALTIVVTALGTTTVSLASRDASSYLPLEVGNRWTYVLDGGEQAVLQGEAQPRHGVKVTSAGTAAGQDVFLVENYLFRFVPSDILFFNDKEGNTVEMRAEGAQNDLPESGLWYAWSDPSGRVKLPEFVFDCVHGSTGSILPTDDSITVPAGTFDDILRIEYNEHPCVDSGVLSEVFARGIGLVERRIITFHGVETWVLEHVELAGAPFEPPSAGGPAGAPPLGGEPRERSWGAIKSVFAQ
jgi:hypothetical protein